MLSRSAGGAGILLASALFWAAFPSLSGTLFLDDPHVWISIGDSWEAFARGLFNPVQRPLARISLAWDRIWFPEAFDPEHLHTLGFFARGAFAGPRLTNFLLHGFNAFCAGLLARRVAPTGFSARAGWLAAALAAFHPAALAAPLYLSQRALLLSVAGTLVACLAALAAAARAEKRAFGAALTGLAVAALSHPQGILAIPFAATCFYLGGKSERTPHFRPLPTVRFLGALAVHSLLFFALALSAGWGVWRWHWERSPEGPFAGVPPSVAAQAGTFLAEGLPLTFFPRIHPADPGLEGTTASATRVAGALLLPAFFVLFFSFSSGRGRGGKLVALGLLGWLAAGVAPAGFPLRDPFFPHRLYLGIVAVSIAGGGLLALRADGHWRAILGAGFLVALLAARAQSAPYADPRRVWMEACRSAPRSARAQMNLGNCWRLSELPARSAAAWRRALSIDPGHRGARASLDRPSLHLPSAGRTSED